MSTPHKCPVCDGHGERDDIRGVLLFGRVKCSACSGSGVVWEPTISIPSVFSQCTCGVATMTHTNPSLTPPQHASSCPMAPSGAATTFYMSCSICDEPCKGHGAGVNS